MFRINGNRRILQVHGRAFFSTLLPQIRTLSFQFFTCVPGLVLGSEAMTVNETWPLPAWALWSIGNHRYISIYSMKGCHDPPPVNTLICFKIEDNKEGIPYGHNPVSQKNTRMDFFSGSLFLLDKFVEENWVKMRHGAKVSRQSFDFDDKVSQCFSQDLASALNAEVEKALGAISPSLSLCCYT